MKRVKIYQENQTGPDVSFFVVRFFLFFFRSLARARFSFLFLSFFRSIDGDGNGRIDDSVGYGLV